MNGTTSAVQGQLHTVQVLDGGTCCAVAAHVSSLADGLVARGLDVTVCAPLAAERAHGFTRTGARFRTLEIGARAVPRDEAAAVAVLRYVCSTAGVVHAHGLRAGLLSAVALRSAATGHHRAPLVVTLHGCAASQQEPPARHGSRSAVAPAAWGRGRLVGLLERRVVRAADIVLGASSELVTRARRLGARDARLAPVAAPGSMVPADPGQLCAKVRADLGVTHAAAAKRPLLLSVLRLSGGPSQRLLLDAARIWRDLDPQPLVLVAGDGPELASVQDRIDAEELPVRLLGPRCDLPDLLAASDIVILPSRWEGRTLIAQGALRAGVPLVATAVGGVPELVGEAASLVPYDDAEALGCAVAELVADPEARAALAERGLAQAATWPGEDDTVAQVLSIYDELAQRPPR